MKTFCINMKDAIARRQHCEKEFEREKIDATFVRGFPGRASDLVMNSANRRWMNCQIGVCISHYMVVEEIRHSNTNEFTLVLEDDVYLPNDFQNKLKNLLYDIPNDFDIACISWFVGNGFEADFRPVNDNWQTFIKGDIFGCAAYIVKNSASAEKILQCISPINSHIDRMFWEGCMNHRIAKGYFSRNNDFIKQGWNFESQNT